MSGPGGLSINTNSANSLFGSSTTQAPAGGMFGSTAASKPATGTSAPQAGGLFGSAPAAQQQTGGLFGSTTTTSQPQTGGLFGSTTTSQPQTGGLFGSTTTSQPQTGGLFGSTATSQPQTGGLFGSTTSTAQPQTGGLFGSTTGQPAQPGGLFGGLNTQNQPKPTSSLFGGLGSTQTQQPQQQQNNMFSSLAGTQQSTGTNPTLNFAPGLSFGQSNAQNQQTIPGVRIDLTNLRGTTRFNDLHEDLQKEITKMDEVLQSQIRLKNDCDAIMPAHDQQLLQIPNDVAFCNRKLTGVENALVSDINSISHVREFIKTDAESAKLSFRAIDNLKLPPQYHNTGIWSTNSSDGRPSESGGDEGQDIVGLFSKTADELSATLTKYQNNLTEIEQHLRGVETSSAQQINAFIAKRNGSSSTVENPVAELGAALLEFEQSILGVAGKVGGAREGVQGLQLGRFQASTNGRPATGGRSGVVVSSMLHKILIGCEDLPFQEFQLVFLKEVFPEVFGIYSVHLNLNVTWNVVDFPIWQDQRCAIFYVPYYLVSKAIIFNLRCAMETYHGGNVPQIQMDAEVSNPPPLDGPVDNDSQFHSSNAEEEETPLEYARLNGLARDHLLETTALMHIATLQDGIFDEPWADDLHLPRLDFGLGPRIEERFPLTQDAARIIQMVAKGETQEEIDAIIFPMLSSKDVSSMKLELPLLRTNHNSDVRNFARREGFETRLEDIKLPLEMVNNENNEGIEFPTAYYQLGHQIMEDLKKEKLVVSREAVSFLQDIIQDTFTEEDKDEVVRNEINYKKIYVRAPVTPPLMPMSSPPKLYEPSPSSPAYQLPILPEPDSMFKEDVEKLEKHIAEQDLPTPIRQAVSNQRNSSSSDTYPGDGTVKLEDIYSPMAFLNKNSPPKVEVERVKHQDLKIEGPLTPPAPTITKHVRFNDLIQEFDMDIESMFPVIAEESPQEPEETDTFFRDAFGEASRKAMQQCEQETLVAADTTGRVEVKVLPDYKPEPPWKDFQDTKSSAKFESVQKRMMWEIIGSTMKPWTGASRGVIYRWAPFPRELAKIEVEEKSELDNETWKDFVDPDNKEEVIDSSMLCWKRPGLKVLCINEEDDDEIEKGKFSEGHPQSISFLVKKRKMELEEDKLEENQSRQKQSKIANEGLKKNLSARSIPKPTEFISAAEKLQFDHSEQYKLLLSDTFSAGNLLGNYMELWGRKAKQVDSGYFPSKPNTEPSQQAPPQTTSISTGATVLQQPVLNSPIAKSPPIPTPAINSAETPTEIVVSATLLKHRGLIKHLEKILPKIKLVERYFTAHNTTTWIVGSVIRSPVTSPLDSEADLIVSPSAGVILTTLQKLKQKPLPGQKTKPAIRDRLEKVSVRYEKLAVLVTEGRNDETSDGLAEGDCLALSEFTGFVSGLKARVIVQFVAGGEETLAKWLAATIMQNRDPTDPSLLSEETHWELFLRRAGMNAFAAQCIIAELKAPEGMNELSLTKVGHSGLTAFVEMGKEQRLVRFGARYGVRVLERVSSVIDQIWE
ncbi:hypothetical protein G7Y89_g2425 [Cudoniella acicularis]|uniref:Uncharacterized protein n=1 Tax=Cudoniella acicularis TaxID=354080 RepID=A0A8H4RTG4_9HELO|nr:hypothetical protein G7Y89_g2425 [Cudoniella acicularis]